MGKRPTRGGWEGGAPEAEAGRGGSRTRSGGRRRRTGGVAGGNGVSGSVDGGFREASSGGEPGGRAWGAWRKSLIWEMTGTAWSEYTSHLLLFDFSGSTFFRVSWVYLARV
jgi:hypothetical protein